ncbi:MAG: hypothetical protein WAN86_16075 [Hyphomicrobiaceae bacterium]
MKKLAVIAAMGTIMVATLLGTQLRAEDTGPAIEKFRAAYESGQGLSYVVMKDDKSERIYRYGDASRQAAKKEKAGFMLFTCLRPHVLDLDRISHRAKLATAKVVHAGEPGFGDLDARYLKGCLNPLVKTAIPKAKAEAKTKIKTEDKAKAEVKAEDQAKQK